MPAKPTAGLAPGQPAVFFCLAFAAGVQIAVPRRYGIVMIPLRDSIPSRTTPVVNYAIIALCSVAFVLQISSPDGGNRIVEQYGMVPLRLSDPEATPTIERQEAFTTPRGIQVQVTEHELAPAAVAPWMTLISCMFLHGGWMHFLGNMWFLYIFGDNVEDRFGHLGFALMYLGTGVLASVAHFVSGPDSPIPTIGASGAIAGVMGAYAWLYPHARVLAVLPLVVIIQTFVRPAPVFLAIWFWLQTISGISAAASGAAVGVAWWAHIGGFVAGLLLALAIGRTRYARHPVAEHRF